MTYTMTQMTKAFKQSEDREIESITEPKHAAGEVDQEVDEYIRVAPGEASMDGVIDVTSTLSM